MDFEKEMAMFRYGVIMPLRHGNDERSLKKRIGEQSTKIWTLPNGRLRQFSCSTIEDWIYAYKRDGMRGLTTGQRSDKGDFREIGDEVRSYIDKHISEYPQLKISIMINRMKAARVIIDNHPSVSTIYRYVKTIRPQKGAPLKERRSFEAPYAGNLWQTDIMYGPYLPQLNDRGRWTKKQTFLVAIIDDHSRLLCHGEFFFKQDVLAYLSCLKTALHKRGIPEKLYCDNGQVFLSVQVKRIMAELGTIVLHTQIRDCAAKGKIERFFLTVRNSFLNPLMALDKPKKLEELNRKFFKWSETEYNLKRHSTINTTPIERWMNTAHKVRLFDINSEDETFYFETSRKVKKDGTFSLDSKIFETSWTLAGKKITVKYDPFVPERPMVSYDNQDFGRATPLNRDFNNKLPGRKKLQEDNKNDQP
jgi:transposase InsO family protein